MSKFSANVSENTISSMSSVEKRILVDSDLILHGYRLRFSELFEYLLQMTREIQKMEETSHPGYFCSHFNITSISLCYGNRIRIDDDIDQYIEEMPIDVDKAWVDAQNVKLNMSVEQKRESEKDCILSAKEYTEEYLKKHDEWDDIPSTFINNMCLINFALDETIGDSIIELNVFYHAILSHKSSQKVLSTEEHLRKRNDKLKNKIRSYFKLMLSREMGVYRLLHFDGGILYDFMKNQQILDTEDDAAALIIGKEFLNMIKDAEQDLDNYERVGGVHLFRKKKDDNNTSLCDEEL